MDIATIIGLVVGFGGILVGYLAEGGIFSKLIQPTAASIVFGGTIGAVLISFPLSDLKKMISSIKTVFTQKSLNEVDIINKLAELSEKARKDGLLSLEQDAQTNENPLIKKGLALVVDGIETEVIKDILERENELHENISESAAKVLEAAGGYSPTMGVLGTVMGMVHILGNIGGNTTELAKAISVAFIATMYGVMFANIVYIPMATKIKAKAARDRMVSDIIIEGLLSIQAGENPRIIKEKLNLTLLEQLNSKDKAAAGTDVAAREAEG